MAVGKKHHGDELVVSDGREERPHVEEPVVCVMGVLQDVYDFLVGPEPHVMFIR